jgi:hypothetical protein
MKTYMKLFLAATLMVAIGMVAAGAAVAGEQPIWHNFTNKATLSGTLPSEVFHTNTNPIWQAQVDTFQKAGSSQNADRQVSSSAMAEKTMFTKPIWCELTKCP